MITLRIFESETSGYREVQVTTVPFTIGRSPENDLIIAHPSVSSKHAIIEVNTQRQVILKDRKSTNGVSVDGKRAQLIQLTQELTFYLGDIKVVASPYRAHERTQVSYRGQVEEKRSFDQFFQALNDIEQNQYTKKILRAYPVIAILLYFALDDVIEDRFVDLQFKPSQSFEVPNGLLWLQHIVIYLSGLGTFYWLTWPLRGQFFPKKGAGIALALVSTLFLLEGPNLESFDDPDAQFPGRVTQAPRPISSSTHPVSQLMVKIDQSYEKQKKLNKKNESASPTPSSSP